MDRSRNLIIILIVIILILIIALVGAMVYIFMNQDNNNNNNEIVVDNSANSGNVVDNDDEGEVDDVEQMAIQTFNSQFTPYEGTNLTAAQIKSLISMVLTINNTTGYKVVLNEEGIYLVEQVKNEAKYDVELYYDDEGYVNEISIKEASGEGEENPEEPETPQQPNTPTQGANDMDKAIFNTAFMSYVGNINGDRLNSLLQVIQDSNSKYPEHQVTLSSNNLQTLEGIVATDIYTITLSYDGNGYINNINIDKQIQ